MTLHVKAALVMIAMAVSATMIVANQRIETADVVRARAFEVVSSDGVRRARLGCSGGGVALQFDDPNSKARVWLQLQADGSPVLTFEHRDTGRVGVTCALLNGTTPTLILGRSAAGSYVTCRVDENGSAQLTFFDSRNAARVVVGLDKDGRPDIKLGAD